MSNEYKNQNRLATSKLQPKQQQEAADSKNTLRMHQRIVYFDIML